MLIEKICDLLIDALRGAGYNESTIFNYHGLIRRFKAFCEKKGVTEYSVAIGQSYANDVLSTKTGKFSKNRYQTQGRLIRLLNSYLTRGAFDFSTLKRGRQLPSDPEQLEKFNEYSAPNSVLCLSINR